MTGVAGNGTLERKRCLKTAHRIEKVDFHLGLDVPAAHRTRPSPVAAAECAARTAKQAAESVNVKLIVAAGARRWLMPLLFASGFRGVKTRSAPGLREFVVE